MRRKASLLLLLAGLSACAIAACGDDDTPATPAPKTDAGGTTDSPTTPLTDSGPGADVVTTDANDGNVPNNEFTAYVKDLIQNHTGETNTPDDWTTRTFTDSEDGIDAVNSQSFPASFFP